MQQNPTTKLSPMFDGRRPVSPITRYWYYVERKKGCWGWRATTGDDGYGILRDRTRCIKAHRLSWEIHKGPIPKGLCVLHKCDNRICTNPDHLFIGTRMDNVADATQKGRVAKGDSHVHAKLTETLVRQIRDRLKNGEKGFYLAKEFRVNPSCISKIKNRTHWKHVT